MTPNSLIAIMICGGLLVWLIASTVLSNYIGLHRWWAKLLLAPWYLVGQLSMAFPIIMIPVIWLVQPWADFAEEIELWFYRYHQKQIYKFRCTLHAGDQIYVPYSEIFSGAWCRIVKVEEHWVTLEAYGREFQYTIDYLYSQVKK